MDTFESLILDIVEDVHSHGRSMNDTKLALKLAKEYREEIRISLARTFEERE